MNLLSNNIYLKVSSATTMVKLSWTPEVLIQVTKLNKYQFQFFIDKSLYKLIIYYFRIALCQDHFTIVHSLLIFGKLHICNLNVQVACIRKYSKIIFSYKKDLFSLLELCIFLCIYMSKCFPLFNKIILICSFKIQRNVHPLILILST